MKQALFDTNVILDIALNRPPHFDHSARLFTLIDDKKITGYVTASTITDIYYIAKREIGHKKSIEFLSDLVQVVEVLAVDKNVIIEALNSEMKDFEDAVQITAAALNSLDCVITRNTSDFTSSGVNIHTPLQFYQSYR